jgi:hypothetical protein
MAPTGTERLDSITDSAWYIIGAITLVLVADRILSTIALLAQKAGVAGHYASAELAYAVIMTVVGISSTTLALSDEWCRSIVSALSVGLGFALRNVVVEVLVGMQMSAHINKDDTFTIREKLNDSKPTQKFTIRERKLLSCKVQTLDDKEDFIIPWTMLHAQVLCITS